VLLRLLDSVSLLCQRWRHVERLESSFQRRQYGMRTASLNQSSRGKVPTFHRSLGHRLISISISHACAKQWSYPSKVKTPAFACRTDCRALLERRSAEGQILLNAGSRSICNVQAFAKTKRTCLGPSRARTKIFSALGFGGDEQAHCRVDPTCAPHAVLHLSHAYS
jgi:hypothetical protein